MFMIDGEAIRRRWDAVGSKLDERGGGFSRLARSGRWGVAGSRRSQASRVWRAARSSTG